MVRVGDAAERSPRRSSLARSARSLVSVTIGLPAESSAMPRPPHLAQTVV